VGACFSRWIQGRRREPWGAGMMVARLHGDEHAQGLIEFAILATTALLIFFGAVDFSRFLYYDNSIRSAARVGAEVGSQHCPFRAGTCAVSGSAVSDSFVMWSTSCEASASGNVSLAPSYTSCTPGTIPSWTPTCSGTCTPCATDICVSPVDASRGTHSQVTVDVGYNFRPITPLMAPFFQDQSCYSGDSMAVNHHTLCAESVGRVF
jgi:TadE-like protein